MDKYRKNNFLAEYSVSNARYIKVTQENNPFKEYLLLGPLRLLKTAQKGREREQYFICT